MALDNSQKRKLSVFFKCLLISLLGWFLFALSNTYTYTKKAPLIYINEPRAKALRSLQSDTVQLRLEAVGWQLLFSSILREEKPLQVDLSGLTNRNWILFSNQLGFLNRQFSDNQKVVSVNPDTLFFDFTRQSEKKVPVHVVQNIRFGKQYGIVNAIKANPEFVTVLGPQEEVAKVNSWETDTIRISNARSPVSKIVALKNPPVGNVKVYPHQVEVQIPVGEMTEKTFEIPITVINRAGYRSVRLLPSKITLKVMVSLQDFPKINSRDFEAKVDLEDWIEWKTNTLPVRISKIPDYCQLVSMSSQNVDFFVIK